MAERKKQKPQAPPRSKVIQLLEEIERVVGNQECIFRGEPSDKFEKITSSLYRKLDEPYIIDTEPLARGQMEQITEALETLLARCASAKADDKKRLTKGEVGTNMEKIQSIVAGNDPVPEKHKGAILQQLQGVYAVEAGRRAGYTKSGVEILAELQHYGGETNLIDFSENYLTALFFACNDDAYSDDDGRLVILPKQGIQEAPSVAPITPNKSCIVRPLPDNRRALVQRSVMLHEPKGYLEYTDERLKVIKVSRKLKRDILDHLSIFCDISVESLFPDLQGYIESQKFVRRLMGYFAKAQELSESMKYEDMLTACNRGLALDDKNAGLYSLRAGAYMGLKDYANGLSDANLAISMEDRNPAPFYIRARIYMGLNDHKNGLKDINRAIALGGPQAYFFQVRGTAHLGLADYDEALSDFDRAIELDEQDTFSRDARAILYKRLGRNEDALSDYSYLIELNENNAKAYLDRAWIHLELENYENALKDSKCAVELGDEDVESYKARAISYAQMKNYTEALEDMNRVLDLGDRSALSYHARAELYEKLGEYDKALEDINRAIKIDDQNPELYKTKARIYKRLEDSENMLSNIGHATTLETKNISSLMTRLRKIGTGPLSPEDREAILEDMKKAKGEWDATLKESEEPEQAELGEQIRPMLIYSYIQWLAVYVAFCKSQKLWDEAKNHLKDILELTQKHNLTDWNEQVQRELDELNKPNPK